MVRFLHTADWQLGMTRHFLDAEAQGRFSQDRIDAIVRMAELAAARDCAFVVVAGDVFETNQPDRRTMDRALDALRAFSMPVYLLPGNHDAYEPGSVYRSEVFAAQCPSHVAVLDDTTPRVPVEGIEIVGAPLRNRRPIGDPVTPACTRSATPSARRIVVGHGAVDAISGDHDDPGRVRLDDLEGAVIANDIAYVALGDRHSATEVGATGRIWYSGAPEPTSYVETDAGYALVVTLDDDAAQRPAVEAAPIGRWSFAVLEREVTSLEDVTALLADLDAIGDKARAIIKVQVQGVLTLTQAAALDAGLEARAEAFGALEAPERHRDIVIRPDDDELAELPLPGYLAQVRDTLRAQAHGTGTDAEVARDALALLVRYATGGRP